MSAKKTNKVLEYLQSLHTAEIGAMGIYMDQHVRCSNVGLSKLAAMLKDDAAEEMHHAEEVAERILFLGGSLQYGKHDIPKTGPLDLPEMLKLDVEVEKYAIMQLNGGIRICADEADNGTRLLLEHILKEEEAHLKDYETMLNHVGKYGDTYIVQHLL
ncbi:MAG: bacterioferritin [Nitrospinae bacterium]|nr:bacterioferritin [Nitrospinota bacterium]